jgi:hypothetical protein
MSSWVEDEARAEAMLYRDGPEIWRDLKVSIKNAVEDYTRIYTPPGTVDVQYMDYQKAGETSILLRIDPGSSFEIRFDPETHKIVCAQGQVELLLVMRDGEIAIRGPHGELESLEDASKAILKPLFSKLPHRRPKIDL